MHTDSYRFFRNTLLAISLSVAGVNVSFGQEVKPSTQPAQVNKIVINMELTGALPEEAFDELAKQSGMKFITQENLWDSDDMLNPIEISFKERSFWSAMRELCSKTKLQPQMNSGGNNSNTRRITLQPQFNRGNKKAMSWGDMPYTESDGFLIQGVSFNRQQSINYQMPENSQNYCTVQLMVYVDPALRVSSFNSSAKVEEAVDDNGNSMVPDEKNRLMFGGSAGERSLIYNVNAPLKYPTTNPGKKIAKLRGTLSLRGGTKLERLVVDKPLEAAETSKTFGDTTVTFNSLKKVGKGEGNQAQYTLKVTFEGDDENRNSSQYYNTIRMAQLVDAKGRVMNSNGGDSNNNEFTFQYSARGGDEGEVGEPVKWSLELPVDVKSIKVPFELKDLPMP